MNDIRDVSGFFTPPYKKNPHVLLLCQFEERYCWEIFLNRHLFFVTFSKRAFLGNWYNDALAIGGGRRALLETEKNTTNRRKPQ